MLRRYGVQIFFYAHDHVFTDMVVDGVHYTLPGSAGALWKFDTSETGYTSYWPDSGYGRVKVTADASRSISSRWAAACSPVSRRPDPDS